MSVVSTPTSRSKAPEVPVFEIFLSADTAAHVFGFLGPREIATSSKVCRTIHQGCNADEIWKDQCDLLGVKENMIPEGISQRKFIQDLYPRIFGLEVYRKMGDIGTIPPIPDDLIRWAFRQDPAGEPGELVSHNYQLIYDPGSIAVTLDDNSPLLPKDWPSKGGKILVRVPLTLNYKIRLAKEYLQNQDFPFRGIAHTVHSLYRGFFERNGNIGIEPHFSYQRKKPICIGRSFADLQKAAKKAGLEIVDATDRVVYNIMAQASDQSQCDQGQSLALTLAKKRDGRKTPTCVWMTKEGKLVVEDSIFHPFDDSHPCVGVAVGIPVKKPNPVILQKKTDTSHSPFVARACLFLFLSAIFFLAVVNRRHRELYPL